MPVSIHPWLSFSPHTFALFIAPPTTIQEALNYLLDGNQGRVLYLCGNYPEVLPGITTDPGLFQVRRALTAYQILSILEESDESLTLFEHDQSLYEDDADLLIPIGERCRQRSGDTGSVILFAARPDAWLNRLEPYASRVAFIIRIDPVRAKGGRKVPSKQQTLEGL